MSMTTSTARPKRSRSAASADGQKAKRRVPSKTGDLKPTVSAEQRHTMIALSAYCRAERRGFQGGDPTQDWLESEHEVDALLSRAAD